MGIVTKTGDKGITSLLGGRRVSKSSLRVETYGCVDELNTLLGFAIALSEDGFLVEELNLVQNDLHLLSSHIALQNDADEKIRKIIPNFDKNRIEKIEKMIEKFESELPPLKNFIHYRGNKFSSFLNVLRSVARRAERRAVELNQKEGLKEEIIVYLNRLSDLFFVMSRVANKHYKIEEKLWNKEE